MTFDILCPSYNYGRYIREATLSVLKQDCAATYRISDGGSRDETLAVLAELASPNIDVVSEPDEGQSDALNKSLARSNGDVLGWLNADEFYLPGALQAVEAAFSKMPEVDMVYGDVIFVDKDGRFERLVAQPDWSRFVLRNRGCYVSTCAAFVRRSLVEEFMFDSSLRVIMDWDYFLYVSERARRVTHVSRPLAAFRVHDERVTATPLSRRSVEHQSVRQRHGLAQGRWQAPSTWAGDVVHRSRKITGGARSIERHGLVYRGVTMSWIDGPRQQSQILEVCDSLSR